MPRRSYLIGLVCLVAVVGMAIEPVAGQGDILYGAMGGTTLIRIDTSTRIATVIGPIGFSAVGGLAFGNDGTLYGITTTSDAILKINLATGAGQSIGTVGAPVTFSTGLGNDPVGDLLYGTTTQGVGFSSLLVTYSKTTGKATPVGDTKTSAVVGLGFDAAGQLWGVDGGGGNEELIRINKSTAATVVVGAKGLAAYSGIGCFDIGPSGTFWAVNSTGSAYQLVKINPTTGAPTLVGTLLGVTASGGMTGLASLRSAQVVGSGAPSLGGTVNLMLTATADAGLIYQVGTSLGTGPIPIDTRKLGLSLDGLLEVSVKGLLPGVFRNYAGKLDASGAATASIVIPNQTGLIGVRLHSAFVTLKLGAPSNIRSISQTYTFTVTK